MEEMKDVRADSCIDSADLANRNIYGTGIYAAIRAAPETSAVIALLALCIVVSLLSPYFLGVKNILNVLQQITILAIIAVGQSLVIITGGIDLSVGSVLSLGGVLAATLSQVGFNSWIAVIAAMAGGALCGLVNGLITVKVGINAFIVTLGTDFIFRGAAFLISDGMPINFKTPASVLGSGFVGIVPVSVIVMFVINIAFDTFMKRTVMGLHYYAVGGNANSARLAGVKVDTIKVLAFVTTGCLAAFAGVINAGNLLIADTNSGRTIPLETIAAAVIGGTMLSGGQGSVIGVLFGAAIMGILNNAFVLIGLSGYWQMVSLGTVIILSVVADRLREAR
jgi:ribose transport system permease protein